MPGDLFEILSGDSDYTSVSHSDSEKSYPEKNTIIAICFFLFQWQVQT